jgi:hypothetical protein
MEGRVQTVAHAVFDVMVAARHTQITRHYEHFVAQQFAAKEVEASFVNTLFSRQW